MSQSVESRFREYEDRVLFGLFLVLAILVVLFRGQPVLDMLDGWAAGGEPFEAMSARLEGGLPLVLRVGIGGLYAAIHAVVAGLAGLFFADPAASPLFQGEQWPFQAVPTATVEDVYIPLISMFATRAIALLPVLVVIRRLFPSFAASALVLVVVFSALGGWPPVLVNGFFAAMRAVMDWPLAYFHFSQTFLAMDYAAIGGVAFLAFVLAGGRTPGFVVTAAMAAVLQACFENLGFVTGVAVFLFVLSEPDGRPWRQRLRTATGHLFSAGLASIAALAAIMALVFTVGHVPSAGGEFGGISAYLAEKWSFAREFYLNPKFSAALVATLLVFPVAIGAPLGLAAGALCPAVERAAIARQIRALAAVSAAFVLACVIGSIVSGYLSDMGRQFIPLVVTLLLLSAKSAQWLRAR